MKTITFDFMLIDVSLRIQWTNGCLHYSAAFQQTDGLVILGVIVFISSQDKNYMYYVTKRKREKVVKRLKIIKL